MAFSNMRVMALAAILSASLTAFAASGEVALASSSKVPRLSVQWWLVKEAMVQAFEGALQKPAAMGMHGVAFAGPFGADAQGPQGLKAVLQRTGLTANIF